MIGLGAAAVAGPAAISGAKSIVVHGNWKIVSGARITWPTLQKPGGIHPRIEKYFIRYVRLPNGDVDEFRVAIANLQWHRKGEIADEEQTEHIDASRARDGGNSGDSG